MVHTLCLSQGARVLTMPAAVSCRQTVSLFRAVTIHLRARNLDEAESFPS